MLFRSFKDQVAGLQNQTLEQHRQVLESLRAMEVAFTEQLTQVREMVFTKRDRVFDKIDEFDRRLGEDLAGLATTATERENQLRSQLDQLIATIAEQFSQLQADIEAGREVALGDMALLQQSYKVRLEAIQADAQHQKQEIMERLGEVTPQYLADSFMSETRHQFTTLTDKIVRLEINRPELFLTADEYIQSGDRHLASSDYSLALADYDRALEIQPANINLWLNRAKAQQALEQLEAALTSLDRLLSLNPHHSQALYQKGLLLRELRRPEEALSTFDQLTTITPEDAKVWLNRGMILSRLKRREEEIGRAHV